MIDSQTKALIVTLTGYGVGWMLALAYVLYWWSP